MTEKYTWHYDGYVPTSNEIFVFGSNLSGIHGAGAARAAYNHFEAEWGVGVGRTGNSYAIPTKNKNISAALPLSEIKAYVEEFVNYMKENPQLQFWLTRIGCGFAGYTDDQIAPMFRGMPHNVSIPKQWEPFLNE